MPQRMEGVISGIPIDAATSTQSALNARGAHCLRDLNALLNVCLVLKRGKSRERRMAEHKIYEHHEQAAQHYEHAAKHHREAAKHHKAGNHEKAAHHARIAFGHYLEASEHQNNAARQHAKQHS